MIGSGSSRRIHVVAAAIVNARDEVLLALRPERAHQGGRWEFPGGKLEPGEAPRRGLERELEEELAIRVRRLRPLIRIPHDYPDRALLLDVWRIDAWEGEPRGREGQTIEWVPRRDLRERAFPAADAPVLTALRLPPTYLITPEPGDDEAAFLGALDASLTAGARLVQLRIKRSSPDHRSRLVDGARMLCRARGATLLLNADPGLARRLGADGAHLDAGTLMGLETRPGTGLLAASCHDRRELAHAGRLGLDFAVLSPVKPTRSHPAAAPLGWARFEALVAGATVPVYALGGMTVDDLTTAWRAGGQGIAAIRGLWKRGAGRASD